MNPMTMYTATVAGQQNNTHYPTRYTVTTVDDLVAVARLDHVVAGYAGGRRSSHGFQVSDTLVMDIDNDHTEDPTEWITPTSSPTSWPGCRS